MTIELPISGDPDLPGSSHGGPLAKTPESESPAGSRVNYFGDYELLEEIAHGGMGVVYKARQLSLNRPVALKMILSGLFASEEEVKRFRTEAEAAANLDHPNIVPIYEIGEHDGRHYFSMRLVDGESLARQIGKFQSDLKSAAEVMATIARAVHHAHQRGILHRDLKPSNILLDAEGQPHVTDFGLAKLLKKASGVTQSGSPMGTPSYMAPEQAQGRTKELTTTSDVFSLGAMLYQMLTGELPFRGETPLATVRQVVEVEPQRPGAVNRRVDRDLATICLKCLEKDPQRRYGSAEALADDLERWLHDEPIRARPSTPWARLFRWARRNPAVAAMISISLVASVGLIAQTLTGKARLQRERDYAIGQQRRAEFEARQAELGRAESLLREGDALAANNRFSEAKDRINKSRGICLVAKTEPLPAELSLMEIYRFSPPPLLTLKGHEEKVTCVGVSIDQKTIVSGGKDGAIRAWSCPSGRQQAVWNAHPGGVECMALSPDGSLCVSGGMDKKIKIWDMHKSLLVNTLEGHGSRVSSISFPPKGDVFASASWDRTIRIWRPSSGDLVQVLKTDQNQIWGIAFAPDGRRILAGSADKKLEVWPLDDPEHPVRFEEDQICICVAYSPDGKLVLSGGSRFNLVLRKSNTGQPLKFMRMQSAVTSLAFFPSQERALSGASDGTISVWDLTSARQDPLMMLSDHEDAVPAIATFADDRLAVSASHDGTVRIWDTIPMREVPVLSGHRDFVSRALFAPDGQLILSAGWDGQLKLWDAATGYLLLDYAGHPGIIFDVALSQNGRFAVSAGQDGIVRHWDVLEGKEMQSFSAGGKVLRCVAFSPDANLIFAGEGLPPETVSLPTLNDLRQPSKVYAWEVAAKRELCRFYAHDGGVLALAPSPDGRILFTGGEDGMVRAWDTKTWKEIQSFEADKVGVVSIALTHEGARCITGGRLRTLKVWDVATGREIQCFPGLKDEARCLAVSQDDSRLLAGMNNGTMRLWDLVTGHELHSFLTWHSGSICGVGFAPNGKMAVSASADHTMKLWDLDRAATYDRLGRAAEKAQTKIQENPHDGASLRTLAEWYEFRGIWRWAAELFEQARLQGAEIPSLALARCYWQADELDHADIEMKRAVERQEAPDYYLHLCVQAISRQIRSIHPMFANPAPPAN